MKTCNDCKEMRNKTRYSVCIAENDETILPIKNFLTDMTDCSLFEQK